MPNPSLRDEATARIRAHLAEGFHAPENFAPDIIEGLADEHDEAEVRRVVDELLPILVAEREADMRSWHRVTDCDRLDAAFEELNARGVMARHNWWCCRNCGRSAMPDEFQRLDGEWEGRPIIGYAFYHNQDTERAVEGGGIYLGYGSCESADTEAAYEARSVEVARMAVDALERHGLKVTWDGTYDTCPRIDLLWQRRARPERFWEMDQ
jgi:hypothetical protein